MNGRGGQRIALLNDDMRSLQLKFATLLVLLLAVPVAAQPGNPGQGKIDLALLESLAAGCSTEPVIIRTRPGFRPGLAQVLKDQRGVVTIEHPSIDAVTAELPCEDFATLESFDEILSISMDAAVLPAGKKGPKVIKRGQLPAEAAAAARAKVKKLPPLERPARHQRDTFVIPRAEKASKVNVPVSETRDAEGQSARAAQGWLFETLGLWLSGDAELNLYTDALARPGIGVAIVDSGIEPSADFNGRITHFYDFTSGRPRKANPSDGYGHGTHIAGLIGSSYLGLAPNARLVGLRVLGNMGQGRTSDVIQAIEFATENRDLLGIDIINISLGHPVYEPAATDPLVQAVEAAVRSGLVVIAAAGNFGINPATGEPGYAGIMSPGNAPSAITAGALQTFNSAKRGDDVVAPYSSRGPTWYDAYAKPDIVAPGHNLLSVAARNSHLRRQHEKLGGRGEYMRLSGSSMAAGVTSGLAAAVLAARPGLSPNALKMALQYTAIPVKGFDALTQGTGGINGQGALDLTNRIDTTTPYGQKWMPAGFPTYSNIAGENLDWAASVIWGGYRVAGDVVATMNHGVWDRNIVWGTFRDEWDNIVWGTFFREDDNIVWGTFFGFSEDDNIVWGTNIVWGGRFEVDDIVWGSNIFPGSWFEDDNIVWGTNIVWGSALIGVDLDGGGDNIVWGTDAEFDNIVWGTSDILFEADNIVWGTLYDFNIVWSNSRRHDIEGDNIVWGTMRERLAEGDNVVWGTSVAWGDSWIVGARPKGKGR
jgi:serine protease AprX